MILQFILILEDLMSNIIMQDQKIRSNPNSNPFQYCMILEFILMLEVLPEVVRTTENRSNQLQQNLVLLLFQTCRDCCFVLHLSDA